MDYLRAKRVATEQDRRKDAWGWKFQEFLYLIQKNKKG